MASKGQVTIANRLLRIIEKEKRINKFDLMEKAGIGIDTFNKLSAWFQHRYAKFVSYDSKSKEFIHNEIESNPSQI